MGKGIRVKLKKAEPAKPGVLRAKTASGKIVSASALPGEGIAGLLGRAKQQLSKQARPAERHYVPLAERMRRLKEKSKKK